MVDVDEELSSEEPVAPSPGFVTAVMEDVQLDRRAPPPVGPPILALVAWCFAILAVVAGLAGGVLSGTRHSAADIRLVEAIARLSACVEWAISSGARTLVATLGLVIAILVVRHAERSV